MPSDIDMVNSVWIKFDVRRGMFGIKTTTYFGDENIYFANDVDFSFVFPARPRPGITKMNISTNGIVMKVSQPFVISGEMKKNENNTTTLVLRLHHQ
ncbi:MAG: hypothetical protein ACTSU2_02285 [Promethearchaeota archaeon]